jgi:hypothetical protein
MEVCSQLHALTTLSLGRTPWYPLLRKESEWAPEAVLLCWKPENPLLLPGVDPWTVQPTQHCNDCAIPAPKNICGKDKERRVFNDIINPL